MIKRSPAFHWQSGCTHSPQSLCPCLFGQTSQHWHSKVRETSPTIEQTLGPKSGPDSPDVITGTCALCSKGYHTPPKSLWDLEERL